jgi:hypothetical protein
MRDRRNSETIRNDGEPICSDSLRLNAGPQPIRDRVAILWSNVGSFQIGQPARTCQSDVRALAQRFLYLQQQTNHEKQDVDLRPHLQ